VLDGLEALISSNPDWEVVQTFTNPIYAYDFVLKNQIDLVITDLDMGDVNGEDVLKYLKSKNPDIPVMVLSMHNESAVIKQLMLFGANGYLLKNSGKIEIFKAIESVINGNKFFSDEVLQSALAPEPVQDKGALSELTEREKEIIVLIAKGKTNKEIGGDLFISLRTVETHRNNLMRKLELKGTASLIRFVPFYCLMVLVLHRKCSFQQKPKSLKLLTQIGEPFF
jgi:DNA-binding NarL/FixJ family response regulator